jgi:hypothetical protein
MVKMKVKVTARLLEVAEGRGHEFDGVDSPQQ